MKERMFNFLICLLVSLFIMNISGCALEEETEEENFIQAEYARLFEYLEEESYTQINIYTKERARKESYFLTDSTRAGNIPNEIIVPVSRIICLSTTHLGFINKLGMQQAVVGVGGINYLYDSELRQYAKEGKIHDIGYEGNLNWEKIIDLQPDLLTLYEIEGESSKTAETARRYNIPYIMISEYAEPKSLGQAEWIKIFGMLGKKKQFADSIFNAVNSRYNKLKAQVEKIEQKPKVFTNMPWRGTWYVPGGSSNIANLVEDAGGKYIWQHLPGEHNSPMSIEVVYEKAGSADIWLNAGQSNSLNDIKLTDQRLSNLPAVENQKVYNRTARISPGGGNDYMESGVVNPDKILSDLICIFHPKHCEDSLFYYKKLE